MTVYLIDGYNVMHELRRREGRGGHGDRLSDGELEQERGRLLDRIASFMGGTRDRATVVFDSHRASLQKVESATRNVEVYFGSFGRSADSIIERVSYALSAAENVVVVTSDYGLQKTTFRPNVIRVSSRSFVDDLQNHTRMVANRRDCITMVHRVEDRVDEESLKGLKELRERLAHEEGGGD